MIVPSRSVNNTFDKLENILEASRRHDKLDHIKPIILDLKQAAKVARRGDRQIIMRLTKILSKE